MQFLRALPGALGLILANVVAAPVVRVVKLAALATHPRVKRWPGVAQVHAFLPSTVHKVLSPMADSALLLVALTS
ncbi:hypothetical protein HaLaN_22254, partial [Haematococcus lacustris]